MSSNGSNKKPIRHEGDQYPNSLNNKIKRKIDKKEMEEKIAVLEKKLKSLSEQLDSKPEKKAPLSADYWIGKTHGITQDELERIRRESGILPQRRETMPKGWVKEEQKTLSQSEEDFMKAMKLRKSEEDFMRSMSIRSHNRLGTLPKGMGSDRDEKFIEEQRKHMNEKPKLTVMQKFLIAVGFAKVKETKK